MFSGFVSTRPEELISLSITVACEDPKGGRGFEELRNMTSDLSTSPLKYIIM
jgi:hypothetical protein